MYDDRSKIGTSAANSGVGFGEGGGAARRAGGDSSKPTGTVRITRPFVPSNRATTTQPASGSVAAKRTWASNAIVPVSRSSARPAVARMSNRWVGGTEISSTERVMPASHHWSWSSSHEASDHLTTTIARVLSPTSNRSVMSYSLVRRVSLPMPIGAPFTHT